jgi:hypothetical protein
MSGQFHIQTALPASKAPLVFYEQEAGWTPGPTWTWCQREISYPNPGSNSDRPAKELVTLLCSYYLIKITSISKLTHQLVHCHNPESNSCYDITINNLEILNFVWLPFFDLFNVRIVWQCKVKGQQIVLGYRSGGPGSIPGSTRKKVVGWNGVHSASWVQLRSYLIKE